MMWRWMIALILFAAMVGGGARAQEETQTGTGYLELYPPGDVYQIQVIGADLSEGLLGGLIEAFRGDPRIAIKPKPLELSRLMRSDSADQVKAIDEALGRDPASIAVVMLDPQDRVSIRGPQGRKIWIDSEEWRAEFGRQIGSVMKILKQRKIAVYWVSLPNMRRSEPNEDAQTLNEIIREQLYLTSQKYIDAYAGFADEGGGYSAMGPDLLGKIRLLRENNGVGFTDAGNRKLAHFVERELRRDLTQAKADRTIPLAGSEAEQAAIDPGRAAAKLAKAAGTDSTKPGTSANSGAAPGGATEAPSIASGKGDQKADTGRINLVVPGTGGREDIIPVDLLRPSIPASIIALVNRKETADKPTQLGDLLVDQIPGGLMVMSSITPAIDPAAVESRRRLSPTQTPYFRVMVRGERTTPRADRADDISWPRPEPAPVVVPAVAKTAEPAPALEAKPPPPKPKKTPAENRRARLAPQPE